MDFLNRVNNKLFKAYKKCSVEYHAGGFFVKKDAMYIFIEPNNSLLFLEKSEGLHPFDNDYSKLISDELSIKGKRFELSNLNNNIATYKSGVDEIKILPSIFTENFNERELTELLLDWRNDKAQIFSLAYDVSKSLDS